MSKEHAAELVRLENSMRNNGKQFAVINAAGAHGAYATVYSVHDSLRTALAARTRAGRLYSLVVHDGELEVGEKIHEIQAARYRRITEGEIGDRRFGFEA